MTALRGKRYMDSHLPCGCDARVYWRDDELTPVERNGGILGQGNGQRRCREHRQAFVYTLLKMRMMFGPGLIDVGPGSGVGVDSFLITWTPLERWQAEQEEKERIKRDGEDGEPFPVRTDGEEYERDQRRVASRDR